jgi:hypothetical protein
MCTLALLLYCASKTKGVIELLDGYKTSNWTKLQEEFCGSMTSKGIHLWKWINYATLDVPNLDISIFVLGTPRFPTSSSRKIRCPQSNVSGSFWMIHAVCSGIKHSSSAPNKIGNLSWCLCYHWRSQSVYTCICLRKGNSRSASRTTLEWTQYNNEDGGLSSPSVALNFKILLLF